MVKRALPTFGKGFGQFYLRFTVSVSLPALLWLACLAMSGCDVRSHGWRWKIIDTIRGFCNGYLLPALTTCARNSFAPTWRHHTPHLLPPLRSFPQHLPNLRSSALSTSKTTELKSLKHLAWATIVTTTQQGCFHERVEYVKCKFRHIVADCPPHFTNTCFMRQPPSM